MGRILNDTEGVTRRIALQRLGLAGAATALPALLEACGSSGSPTSLGGKQAASVTSADFTASAGSTIPTTTLRVAMPPFGDGSFYVIGMKRGWFNDVGLQIEPAPYGLKVTPDNVVSFLVNKQADIAMMNGPGVLQAIGQVPQLRLLGLSDTYIGTYILASPATKAVPASRLLAQGMPFNRAMKQVMGQVRGKPIAVNNEGSQRTFLNAAFLTYGGVPYSAVKLTATDDARIVQLATGGNIDFAVPAGAAQTVQLINAGWYPLVSSSDFAKGLPPGSKIVASILNHEGPACMIGTWNQRPETCLRFLSVMFRMIDAVNADPLGALADQVPYLESVSGVKLTVANLRDIYKNLNPLVSYPEQARTYWNTAPDNPLSYTAIYTAQIAAAKAGGVIPTSMKVTPESVVLGATTYRILAELKLRYEQLLPDARKAPGDKVALVQKAAEQARWRNYLDAYRLLKAAIA